MVKEDILGGLRVALEKGNSLQQAMQSFYNSGYKKEDIEEAAREIQRRIYARQHPQPMQPQSSTHPKKPLSSPQQKPLVTPQIKKPIHPPVQKNIPPAKPAPQQINEPTQNPQQPAQKPVQTFQQPKQSISYYGQEKKSIDFVTIILIITLLILLGVLAGVFLFKDSIVSFLNKILE